LARGEDALDQAAALRDAVVGLGGKSDRLRVECDRFNLRQSERLAVEEQRFHEKDGRGYEGESTAQF